MGPLAPSVLPGRPDTRLSERLVPAEPVRWTGTLDAALLRDRQSKAGAAETVRRDAGPY